MRWLFRLDNFICTGFIFAFIGILAYLSLNLSLFDPVEKSLKDFDITDLVFSRFREKPPVDSRIVLVNIGHLDRSGIARELQVINKYDPGLVAIDAFFREKKGPEKDLPLKMAMENTNNLILVSKLEEYNELKNCFGELTLSNPYFNRYASTGFANFITGGTEGYRTTRKFLPTACINGENELIFAAEIARHCDTAALARLLERNNESEVINYRGNYNRFYRLDVSNVLDPEADLSFLKNKIVLMGYMGVPIGQRTLEDIFFTPLNERYAGRTYPDMYGVVVHANILSMILNGNYIDRPPEWLKYFLAVFLCFLNVAVFISVARHFKAYYDLITKSIQMVEMIVLIALIITVLHYFNFKLDLTFAIIVVLFSGDLTEVYYSSLRNVYRNLRKKLKFVKVFR